MIASRVLTLLARALGRGDWGHAMARELDEVTGGEARRRFATGCLRALVVSLPAVALAASGAGLLSLTVVAAALIRFPGLVTGNGTWLAVGFFAALVLSYAVLAAGLSRRLAVSHTLRGSVVTAAGIACAWLAVGTAAAVGVPTAVSVALLVLIPAPALAAGARVTRHACWSTGMQCVGLGSLLAALGLFLALGGATVAFSGRPHDAGLVRDFHASGAHDLATYAVSDSLGAAMMLLLLVPAVSLAAGAFGAAAAVRRGRRTPA